MADLRRTLIQACDDARLLAFDLFPVQRDLLAAVDAGPQIHVWCLGRRSGKTTLIALAMLGNVLLRPDLDAMVRRGEMRYAVGIATNLRQARLIVAAARTIVEHSPALARLLVSDTEDELRFQLPSGAKTAIAAFPCSSRGGRGWPIGLLGMDEAAHFLDTDGHQAADTVWEALVPATLQFGSERRVIMSSTPYGESGLFYEQFTRAASGEMPAAVAHHYPTPNVNLAISPEELAAEEQRDPAAFEQEVMAEFMSPSDAYLDFSRFEIPARGRLEPEQGRAWVAGLDPAFRRDPFGLALVGKDIVDPKRLVLGHAESLPSTGGSFEARIAEVAEIINRYGARAVTDQHMDLALVSALRTHGVSVRVVPMTPASKTSIFELLRSRLYTGGLVLYQEDVLLRELRLLRAKYSPGSASVENPRRGGSHGDVAQALAIAVGEFGGGPSGTTGIRTKTKAGVRASMAGDRRSGDR